MDASTGTAAPTEAAPGTNFLRPVHCLLGLPFDAVSSKEAVQRIVTASEEQPCFLSTPNLNFLITSQRDAEFRNSVIRSDLSVADGMPLVWLAAMLGVPIRERVAGSDLFEQLGTRGGPPIKVFFFGGPDGAAEQACHRVNAMPQAGVRCVGFHSPGFGEVEEMSDPETIARINASGADFVVVALGAAKGQAWIERNRAKLRAPVVSHLGAVVNFTAGRLRRAPVLVRRLGLEWLWRIKEEPALWRRYATDALGLVRLFATRVLPAIAWKACSRFHAGTPARADIRVDARTAHISLSGSWPDADVPAFQRRLQAMAGECHDVEVDLGQAECIDSGLIGLLMLLYGHQSKLGLGYRITAISIRARFALRLHCAEYLLETLERRIG